MLRSCRRVPQRPKVRVIELAAVDVGANLHRADAEMIDDVIKLSDRRADILRRQRAHGREASGIGLDIGRHRFVLQAGPTRALERRQIVASHVGPCRDDLEADTGGVHAGKPVCEIAELVKERPQQRAAVERDTSIAFCVALEPDAVMFAVALDFIKQRG